MVPQALFYYTGSPEAALIFVPDEIRGTGNKKPAKKLASKVNATVYSGLHFFVLCAVPVKIAGQIRELSQDAQLRHYCLQAPSHFPSTVLRELDFSSIGGSDVTFICVW